MFPWEERTVDLRDEMTGDREMESRIGSRTEVAGPISVFESCSRTVAG